MITLRDYQQDAVIGVRESYKRGNQSSLLVVPTGGGKTVIFSNIAMTTSARGKRVWILVHRIELLKQTSAALRKNGVEHGMINPNFTPNLMAPVQVASVQTVVNRLHKYPPPDLIIIDEAHHALAGTWRKVIDAFPRARVLGVTATPCRGDGTGLGKVAGGVFDDLVMGPQIPELIKRGFLVKPVIYAPQQRLDLSSVRIVRGDFDNKQVAEIVDKPSITGDAVDYYKRLAPGVPAVFFCVSVNHAQHVAEAFRQAGFRAYHADGTLDDDTRSRILGGLGDGTVDVVTSCYLISEGTDIPAIGYVGLLRPTNSLGLYLQQVGRGLRTIAGKQNCIIADHVGNVITHGFPDDERDWTLEGTKKKRKKGQQEDNLRVRQCPECFRVHEPTERIVHRDGKPMCACPQCGFVYEPSSKDATPEQVDGELVQITEEQKQEMRRQRNREVAKLRTLEELERYANEKGYKAGWAKYVFNARQSKTA